jgi:TolA-binding protein
VTQHDEEVPDGRTAALKPSEKAGAAGGASTPSQPEAADFGKTRVLGSLPLTEPRRASTTSLTHTVVGLGPVVRSIEQQTTQVLRIDAARDAAERAHLARVDTAYSRRDLTQVLPMIPLPQPAAETQVTAQAVVLRVLRAQLRRPAHGRRLTAGTGRRRLWLVGALAVVVLAVVATWSLTDRSERRAASAPPKAASRPEHAPTPALASPSVHAAPSANAATEIGAAETGKSPHDDDDTPGSSERAAVDALFAGDYAVAAQQYRALAQAHPDQPAFAAAARMLSRPQTFLAPR